MKKVIISICFTKFHRIMLMLCLFFIFSNCKIPTPTAHNGRMDLTQYDMVSKGIVMLKGEWEFYWKQFIAPESFDKQGFHQ